MLSRLLPWIFMLCMGILWGVSFSVAKIAINAGATPMGVAFWQAVIASILLSLFLFASYSTVLRLQEYAGCVPHSNTDFRPGFDTLCQELLKLQLHVQIHSTEYMKVFFTQLKIGFVMFIKHIIDYVFSGV